MREFSDKSRRCDAKRVSEEENLEQVNYCSRRL